MMIFYLLIFDNFVLFAIFRFFSPIVNELTYLLRLIVVLLD